MDKTPSLNGAATTMSVAQHTSDPSKEHCNIQRYHVGVDVGTGSARAVVIDQEGELVGYGSEIITHWQPQPGYCVILL